MDVTACPGRKRFGVLHCNLVSWAYIQMYDVDDAGKATVGLQLRLQDFGVGPEDVSWNALSYSEEYKGFLLVKKAWPQNFELLKIKDLCFADAWGVKAEVFINADCQHCETRAALHLGGNLFAVSVWLPHQQRTLDVIEVLENNNYNKLQTIQASEDLYFSDLFKDDKNNLYVTMSQWAAYGDASISVYRWSPEGKNLTYAVDLLTQKKLLDYPIVGSLSQMGDYIYFTERSSGMAFEYKMRYD